MTDDDIRFTGTIIPEKYMRNKEFDLDEVADLAMNIFWKNGYSATSIQDLVTGTGISRSSLYSVFKNKQDLYHQALYRYQLFTKENIELLSSTGSVKELIRKLLMRIVESELNDSHQKGCLIANASLEVAGHDEKVAKLVSSNFQLLQNALEKLIKKGQQSGEISSSHSPKALAIFFVSTIQGIRVFSKGCSMQNRQQSLSEIVEIALDRL